MFNIVNIRLAGVRFSFSALLPLMLAATLTYALPARRVGQPPLSQEAIQNRYSPPPTPMEKAALLAWEFFLACMAVGFLYLLVMGFKGDLAWRQVLAQRPIFIENLKKIGFQVTSQQGNFAMAEIIGMRIGAEIVFGTDVIQALYVAEIPASRGNMGMPGYFQLSIPVAATRLVKLDGEPQVWSGPGAPAAGILPRRKSGRRRRPFSPPARASCSRMDC